MTKIGSIRTREDAYFMKLLIFDEKNGISQDLREVVGVLPQRKLSQTAESEDYSMNDNINRQVLHSLLIRDFSRLCPMSSLNCSVHSMLPRSN